LHFGSLPTQASVIQGDPDEYDDGESDEGNSDDAAGPNGHDDPGSRDGDDPGPSEVVAPPPSEITPPVTNAPPTGVSSRNCRLSQWFCRAFQHCFGFMTVGFLVFTPFNCLPLLWYPLYPLVCLVDNRVEIWKL